MLMTATDELSANSPRHDAKHLQRQQGGIIVGCMVPGGSGAAQPKCPLTIDPGSKVVGSMDSLAFLWLSAGWMASGAIGGC